MLDIKFIEKLEELSPLKKQYFAQATAPLDGMWHFGFVPMASHFGFYEHGLLVGYCCFNNEGYMLQFYLSPESKLDAKEIFGFIAGQNSQVIGKVNGAFVSTAEAQFLSLCFDNSSSFEVNALMYKQRVSPIKNHENTLVLTLAKPEQLNQFIDFSATNIGAPEQWLASYYSNLINRSELLGYWVDDKLIAAGECRLFDEYQTQYADLGMIVAQSHRSKGIATQVLKSLVKLANERNLTPICSTESSNLGAQKAIERAGLEAQNRIIKMIFKCQ